MSTPTNKNEIVDKVLPLNAQGIVVDWFTIAQITEDTIEVQTEIPILRKWKKQLELLAESLQVEFLNNTRWKSQDAKIKHRRLKSQIKDINIRIIEIQAEQRKIEKAKAQATKSKLTDSNPEIAKVMFSMLSLMSKQEANRQAQAIHRTNVPKKADLVAAAPEMPMPEFKNTPEGQTDRDIVELAKKEIESDPSIDSLTAMLKVQKEVADKGLPMENFDLSQLISNSKPESEPE